MVFQDLYDALVEVLKDKENRKGTSVAILISQRWSLMSK